MVQKHNSHMSFSLYIAALAVSDTAALISGMFVSLPQSVTNQNAQSDAFGLDFKLN